MEHGDRKGAWFSLWIVYVWLVDSFTPWVLSTTNPWVLFTIIPLVLSTTTNPWRYHGQGYNGLTALKRSLKH